ncbi:hypothetical protein Goshw_024758, partial [Gossypium schwendimanii]|nr:hypothetical protein [Gossypium schwendimanii]
MPMPLTRLGHKHISGVQLQMTKDRIIETYIHNLSAKALRVIEQHLQEAGFLHIECTITLKDVALQLSLPVDGIDVTGDAPVRVYAKYPPSHQELDEFSKINLRGKTNEDWPKFHAKYIYILEHMDNSIPMRKPTKPNMTPDEVAVGSTYVKFIIINSNPKYYTDGVTDTLSITVLRRWVIFATTDDIQWEPRMQMHSSMEEQDEDEDEDNVGDEDQDQDGGKGADGDEYEDDEPKPNHNEILLVVDCHRVVAHIRTKDGNDFLILKFSH